VKARTVDAFYVRVLKEMTVDQKLGRVSATKKRLKEVAAAHGITAEGAELLLAREELEGRGHRQVGRPLFQAPYLGHERA
jgi:hypothetical protein